MKKLVGNLWAVIGVCTWIALIIYILGLVGKDTQAQSTTRYITLLSSSGRTATTNSSDQVNIQQNLNIVGVLVTVDVTAVSGSPTITPSIQIKDPASSNYESLLTASTGITTTGTHSYLVYPGIGAAGADITQVASYPIGHVWRVQMTHANTNTITYTVGVNLLP